MDLSKYPEFSVLFQEFSPKYLSDINPFPRPECSSCVQSGCVQPMCGYTTPCGVKEWLQTQTAALEAELTEELEEQFQYLDQLRDSSVTNMYGAVPYLKAEFPHWSRNWYPNVLRLWMNTYQERTEG